MSDMRFVILLSIFLGLTFYTVNAQTLNFDQLNSTVGSGRAISFTTSSWGNGFGHRLINGDPGEFTTLNLQYRHNASVWTDAMVVTSLGNIGFGTSNPHNPQGWGKAIEVSSISSSKFLVSTVTNTVRLGFYAHSNWNGPRGIIGTESNHDLSFHTNYSEEHIRIKTNGNVGIGTSSPTNKLEVNGTIKTKEVNVTATGWADYVFEPDYQLIPLSEVEAFIFNNGHLPNIPTEKEVFEQGVNLLEMNIKLLEKIEELTLYIIELKGQYDEQDRKINQIQIKLQNEK